MKLKTIFLLLLVLLIGSLIFYRIKTNANQDEKGAGKNDKKPPIMVKGVVVKPELFNDNLALSGSVEANERVEIHSETSGIVEKINFEEGGIVSKGQLLFKVNDVELKAQLVQANSKERLAFENERRAKLLLEKEAISQEEFDVTRSEYQSAKAQAQLINAQIGKTAVKAPFSGTIGLRTISPGTYITPAVVVANLVNTSQLKITFAIPEKYATQVKLNATIHFKVSSSSTLFEAKIYALEPNLSENTRTMQVKAITDNSKKQLLPGVFADIIFPLVAIKDAIVIPSEAIIPIQSGKKVYVSNHGFAKEVKIETASRTDKSVLVLSGLKMGDTLLTSGIMALKDKAPIKIKLAK